MQWTDSRRETVAAAIASVLLHLLILLCVAAALAIPAWQFPETPAQQDLPIELTIVPAEEPAQAEPTYISTSEQNAQEPPKNAPFESDKNTRAASEAPASGSAPMPSVDGREAAYVELEDKNYKSGKQAQPAAPTPAEQTPPRTQTEPPSSAPTPAMDEPAPTQLALRDVPPKPKTDEQVRDNAAQPAQPKPAVASGFQPETRVTRIKGNISNRGKASVDAAATPLGRYKKMVSDAIGSRWYYYVNDQIGLLNIGTVSVRFTVSPDGKVGGVKVLSNSSNESFASVSVNSIIEAEIPPIPEDVAKLLDNGRLEIDYSFTILSN